MFTSILLAKSLKKNELIAKRISRRNTSLSVKDDSVCKPSLSKPYIKKYILGKKFYIDE